MFHQCKSPITSYGVIAFRENPMQNNRREYLLIRRKDTLGFVDFMRGKYSIYNKEYILNMIKQMTNSEKTRLTNEPFSKMWNDLWGVRPASIVKPQKPTELREDNPSEIIGLHLFASKEECIDVKSSSEESSSSKMNLRETSPNQYSRDPYKIEEQNSRNKFETLKTGVYTKTDSYNLEELVRMTEQKWTEPEWGFPKGRRNYQEKDYDCAIREFCEETGYTIDALIPIKNIQPFEEIFTGSNYKSYKHKYYATYMKYDDTLSSRRFQVCEVSESEWMPFEECYSVIRPYNIEKKRLLIAVDEMLSDNCLSQMYS
jgi:8-oxo-dGTP pyrophosphatase MutT (NUDIX family)